MLVSTPAVILQPEKPAIIRQARPRLIRPDEPQLKYRANFLPFPLAMFGSGAAGGGGGPVTINLGTAGNIAFGMTSAAAIPVGATVVVLTVTNDPAKTVFAIADDGGNSYAQIGSTITSTGFSAAMFYAFDCNSVSSGGQISVAFDGGTASSQSAMSAFAIPGATLTDSLDATAQTSNTGTNSISTSVTAVASKTLMVAGLGQAATSASISSQTGFATPFNALAGSGVFVGGGNKTLAASGSNTYSATMAGSGNLGLILATFKLT